MITYETTEQDGITYQIQQIGNVTSIFQERIRIGRYRKYYEHRLVTTWPTRVKTEKWSIRTSKEL